MLTRKWFRILALALPILFALHSPSEAGLVWDNGPEVGPGRNISGLISGDDFQLTSSTDLTSFRFWATNFNTSTPFSSFDGTISWYFYSNNAGVPGMVLASGFNSAPVVSLYEPAGVYQLDVSIGNVILGPATYWLVLHEGLPGSADDGSDIYWRRSSQQQGASLKSDSNLQNPTTWNAAPSPNDLAFTLTGNAVPEPASLTMLGMGAVAVLGYTRRRRRAVA